MRRLAEEYPGALREIDSLPIEVITSRLEALAEAELDRARAEPWMHAQALFHRLARGALVTKRWLAGRRRITRVTRAAFVAALPELPRPADAELFVDDLASIAAPPAGRLMDVVHARVAATLEVTVVEARVLVFGVPAPARRAR
jgi:hypothetical protein